MAITQRGLVYMVGQTETRQYNDKTYVSRVLIIEQPSYDPYTGEKRNSNYIKLEATREETCKALDNFPVGTKVDFEFIVRGSLYDKKDGSGKDVFTHVELRSIALASAAPAGGAQAAPAGASTLAQVAAPAAPSAPAAPAPQTPAPAGAQSDYDDSLGF